MRIGTLAVVGVGLIGGSIGLAARIRRVAGRVVGVDPDAAGLARAAARGAIDAAAGLDSAAGEADLIVVCTPVDVLAGHILAAAARCRPGTVLTDTGSIKSAVVAAVEGRLPPGVTFVGGHPLAGSDKQGAAHSDAEMFQKRNVVLTPIPSTEPSALKTVRHFWQALGAQVITLSPDEHDRALARTSHLPHLASAALAGTLSPDLSSLTATGFRDTTRIAAGDPALWAAILLANRDPVLSALAPFEDRLARFRAALEAGDRPALLALLAEGQTARHRLD